MATLGNIVVVAQQLLDKLGKGAPEILASRAAGHLEEDDEEAARYWTRVAKSARYILSMDPSYLCTGHGPRPFELSLAMLREVFQCLPQPSLLLQPNLVIVGANRAYLGVMGLTGQDIVGRDLFELLPGNPAVKTMKSTDQLSASFGRVIEACCPDCLDRMRYDVRNREGAFEERWWKPVNTPVFDDEGRLALIMHQAFEIPGHQVPAPRPS